jgi:hypothetical protein
MAVSTGSVTTFSTGRRHQLVLNDVLGYCSTRPILIPYVSTVASVTSTNWIGQMPDSIVVYVRVRGMQSWLSTNLSNTTYMLNQGSPYRTGVAYRRPSVAVYRAVRAVYHSILHKFKNSKRDAYTIGSERYTGRYERYIGRLGRYTSEFAFVSAVFS